MTAQVQGEFEAAGDDIRHLLVRMLVGGHDGAGDEGDFAAGQVAEVDIMAGDAGKNLPAGEKCKRGEGHGLGRQKAEVRRQRSARGD